MARCKACEQDLGKLALRFSASSLEVLPHASVPQTLPQMRLLAGNVALRDRITCLGACLDHCGPTKTMVGHRLEATAMVSGKWRHWLARPALAIHGRLHNTYEAVVARALWGPPLLGCIDVASRCAQCSRAAMDTVGCRMPHHVRTGMASLVSPQGFYIGTKFGCLRRAEHLRYVER